MVYVLFKYKYDCPPDQSIIYKWILIASFKCYCLFLLLLLPAWYGSCTYNNDPIGPVDLLLYPIIYYGHGYIPNKPTFLWELTLYSQGISLVIKKMMINCLGSQSFDIHVGEGYVFIKSILLPKLSLRNSLAHRLNNPRLMQMLKKETNILNSKVRMDSPFPCIQLMVVTMWSFTVPKRQCCSDIKVGSVQPRPLFVWVLRYLLT